MGREEGEEQGEKKKKEARQQKFNLNLMWTHFVLFLHSHFPECFKFTRNPGEIGRKRAPPPHTPTPPPLKCTRMHICTPGPKLGTEETEEHILQSWSWPERREENSYLWFFIRDGLNYVRPKQSFPQIKAFSVGHLCWPANQSGPVMKESKPRNKKH